MYTQAIDDVLSKAIEDTRTELYETAPLIGQRAWSWINSLYEPYGVFLSMRHPLAFPIFLLPWWVEEALRDTVDHVFQTDLMRSTFNGYHYVRLIDNLMDGDTPDDLSLLPLGSFFHTQFMSPYLNYFSPKHDFWKSFNRLWLQSNGAAINDAELEVVRHDTFVEIAAKKTGAASIPVAAVCFRYDRTDLLPPWQEFIDLFGRYHQFLNDLRGWAKDMDHDGRTYFLCEAASRKLPTETIETWIAREGLTWASGVLRGYLSDAKRIARELDSPRIVRYLELRDLLFDTYVDDLVPHVQTSAA